MSALIKYQRRRLRRDRSVLEIGSEPEKREWERWEIPARGKDGEKGSENVNPGSHCDGDFPTPAEVSYRARPLSHENLQNIASSDVWSDSYARSDIIE